jgi:hypothetical protein
METADWALLISLLSLLLAIASFVWNVWSKFIYPKPRLAVGFQKMSILQGGVWRQPHFSMTITNHGPIKTTVYLAVARFRTKNPFKPQNGILNPIHNFPNEPYVGIGPFGGGLPFELEVGKDLRLQFPYEIDGFFGDALLRIGVTDVFGNSHWVRPKILSAAKKQFLKDFPEAKGKAKIFQPSAEE